MKYQVLETIKTKNWEGAIIEDRDHNKKITSGIFIWNATTERITKCEKTSINKESLISKFNKHFQYSELTF
jgi:hypothetical protein